MYPAYRYSKPPVIKMRRPANSLTRAKFIRRLDKGLSVFCARVSCDDDGITQASIYEYENCHNLHWVKFSYDDGAEFINTTWVHTSYEKKNVLKTSRYEDCTSLNDMNVERNDYNLHFAFATRASAEAYLDTLFKKRSNERGYTIWVDNPRQLR